MNRRADSPKNAKASHRHAHAALTALGNPGRARVLAAFFKTGKGQYAEGDRFLGIMVPEVRRLAKQFRELDLPDCEQLLQSRYNEARVLALTILVERYQKGDAKTKAQVFRLYIKNRGRVNNWNLVDGSAPYIVGAHLAHRERSLLYRLARSKSLWDRRIAMVATFAFIRQNDFADTLKLTEQLLSDKHDLIHKACGWMLREVGKRDQPLLEGFLAKHHHAMPRTMLRYAIERFALTKRAAYVSTRSRGGRKIAAPLRLL